MLNFLSVGDLLKNLLRRKLIFRIPETVHLGDTHHSGSAWAFCWVLLCQVIIRPSVFKRKLLKDIIWNNDIIDEYEMFITLKGTIDGNPTYQFDS